MSFAPLNSRPRVLNRTVVVLGLVSLFADISSEMLYPITPIFLTSTLGASMTAVGLIEGTAEALASLLKAFAGAWSDRLAWRRPFIAVGYLLAAVAKPLVGSATHWGHVLAARGLDRTGKGLRGGARDALIAESVAPANVGAAFGWHRAMDTLGAAIGPLIAVAYLSAQPSQTPVQLRSIYYWAFVPGLLSVLLIFLLKEERPVNRKQVGGSGKNYLRPTTYFWSGKVSPAFKTYLVGWAVFSLANSSDVFLIMKAKSTGVSLIKTILMYCFYNLIYALASPYLGSQSDRRGRKKILLVGLGIFALTYFGFAMATREWMFWVLFTIYGLYMAATDGVGKALALDLMPPELKATAIGTLGAVTGGATWIASITAGLLWDRVAPEAALLWGTAGALVGALILSRLKEPPPRGI